MLITCARSGCRNVAEAPETLRTYRVQQLLKEHGWARRGTVNGFDYYCPRHVPAYAALPSQTSRPPRKKRQVIGEGCVSGCARIPLMNLMGHDEIGHRTGRRILEHLRKTVVTLRGEQVAVRDLLGFDESDFPVRMLREMPTADIKRIRGVGEQSLARLAEVLKVKSWSHRP